MKIRCVRLLFLKSISTNIIIMMCIRKYAFLLFCRKATNVVKVFLLLELNL